MPIIPCPNKIACPCENSPFANLSSEAPDLPVFISTAFVRVTPPLGTNWDKQGCLSTCQSTVSQQAADLCAAEQAFLCTTSGWTFDGSGPANGPVPPAQGTAGRNPVPRFFNAQQTGTAICPDGLPFSVTVPPGVFVALSQAAADAEALSYANRQAQLRMICLSGINDSVCVGLPYSATIVATGNFLAVAPQSDTWQVIGSLPPGLTFEGNSNGGLAFISGTPTTAGQFSFFVSITDPQGDTMEKLYVFNVCGITNANSLPAANSGQAYNATLTTAGFNSPTFSVASGSLPAGLSLGASGNISGTSSATGTSTATIQITDAVTGLVCFQTITLTVQGNIHCPNLPVFETSFAGTSLQEATAFRYGGGIHLIMGDISSTGVVAIYNSTTNWTNDASANIGSNLNCLHGGYSKLADRLLMTVQRPSDNETFLYFFQVTGTGPSYGLTFTSVDLQNLANSAGTQLGSVVCDDTTGTAYVGHSAKIVAVDTVHQTVIGYSPSAAAGTYSNGQMGYNSTAKTIYAVRNASGSGFVDVLDSNVNLLTSYILLGTGTNVVYSPDNGNLYVAGNDGGADGGFVVWVLNAATGLLVTTIRYPVANTVRRWQIWMMYNSFNHQVIQPFQQLSFTADGTGIICADSNLWIGNLLCDGRNPNQPAFADNVKRLVVATNQSNETDVYTLP